MPKILLIEDDEQLARFLMRFLNSEGYTTDYANGQKEGLRLFDENAYDCVLLDISLKDGNGYSVCAAIKAQNDTPSFSSPHRQMKPARSQESRSVRMITSENHLAHGNCLPA